MTLWIAAGPRIVGALAAREKAYDCRSCFATTPPSNAFAILVTNVSPRHWPHRQFVPGTRRLKTAGSGCVLFAQSGPSLPLFERGDPDRPHQLTRPCNVFRLIRSGW